MNNSISWEVGHHSPNLTVLDRGERITVTKWLIYRYPEYKIISMLLLRPDETLDVQLLCDQAVNRPMDCGPGEPSLIRCDDEDVATQLAQHFPKARVQVGGTPQLERLFDSWEDGIAEYDSLVVESYEVDAEILIKAGLDPENPDLTQEAQERFAELVLGEYYTSEWLDTRLPALGDRTPRHAVESEEGLRAVQDLLVWMAARSTGMHESMKVDVAKICEALDIPEPNSSDYPPDTTGPT